MGEYSQQYLGVENHLDMISILQLKIGEELSETLGHGLSFWFGLKTLLEIWVELGTAIILFSNSG